MKRRSFIKGSLATSALTIAAGAGLLKPTQVLAADYPQAAFETKTPADAVSAVMGTADAADSGDITLKAPVQAENGAVVPIKVAVSVPTEAIAVVVAGNPSPLVMTANMGNGSGGTLEGRIKMGKTSDVVAYAKTANGVIKASSEVKVTVGGCGG